MKNNRPSRTLRILTRLINIRKWSDWDRMKSMTRNLAISIKKFFIPQKIKHKESFAVAKKRLNLSNQDVIKRQNGLFRLALLMLSISALLFIYASYNFYYTNYMCGFLSLIVMSIALTLAFRYHFWYFQIKNRRLGCSIKEWFTHGLRGSK